MKPLRRLIAIVCLLPVFVHSAGGQPAANAKDGPDQTAAAELQRLQGTWEGVLVGDKARQRITITIIGNSLHFHRDTNFWFATTITLPAGKDPKQLHATIKDRAPSQGVSIGQVVRAFFKIEDGTLTLATIGDDAEETTKGFEDAGTRYELRKVQPQKEKTQPLENKGAGNAEPTHRPNDNERNLPIPGLSSAIFKTKAGSPPRILFGQKVSRPGTDVAVPVAPFVAESGEVVVINRVPIQK